LSRNKNLIGLESSNNLNKNFSNKKLKYFVAKSMKRKNNIAHLKNKVFFNISCKYAFEIKKLTT